MIAMVVWLVIEVTNLFFLQENENQQIGKEDDAVLFHFSGDKPIYLQIAEQLEDAIFTGVYPEETQVPSTTEIAAAERINPATVLKGINLLVEQSLLYKKRGIGMFVKAGATEHIREKRQREFANQFITPLLKEAEKLGISDAEICKLIEKGYKHES